MNLAPFNVPYTCPQSFENVRILVENPLLISQKHFSNLCESYFESLYPGYKAFLTPSCTKALEIIAISLDFNNDEEVIMPSYTYVGVANAFATHNAKIVFADINEDTMNICPNSIERAISNKTKAIVIMHYAGVACEIDEIKALCEKHNIILIEDNAQGINCKYNDQLLGSFGDYSVISFDSMKNISCGEGGVLLCKEKYYSKIIEVYHNGTNRVAFENKLANKYEWTTKGSKFYMSEYNAAVLYPLLLESIQICDKRKEQWDKLYNLLENNPKTIRFLPKKIKSSFHNGHIFYIKCSDENERHLLIKHLEKSGILSIFHYTPLHNSIMAKKLNFSIENDENTTKQSNRILRLQLNYTISEEEIINCFNSF